MPHRVRFIWPEADEAPMVRVTAQVPDETRMTSIMHVKMENYKKDQSVYRIGDSPEKFYIILTGVTITCYFSPNRCLGCALWPVCLTWLVACSIMCLTPINLQFGHCAVEVGVLIHPMTCSPAVTNWQRSAPCNQPADQQLSTQLPAAWHAYPMRVCMAVFHCLACISHTYLRVTTHMQARWRCGPTPPGTPVSAPSLQA